MKAKITKHLTFISLIFFLNGCGFESNLIKVGKKTLNDKSVIELYYFGGGATAPDVVWVKKMVKNDQWYIGKIKWYCPDGYETNIWQINDTLIKIRFIDTSTWKGTHTDFIINTNNRIEPNDGRCMLIVPIDKKNNILKP